MSLYEMFETNTEKEANGVRIGIGKNKDGSIPVFIVGAMYKSNPKYMKALERVTEQYKIELRTETLSNAVAEEVNLDVFVETVLFGWENVLDREGKPLPFNKENAKKFLQELPRLYDLLQEKASKMATFKAHIAETQAKN